MIRKEGVLTDCLFGKISLSIQYEYGAQICDKAFLACTAGAEGGSAGKVAGGYFPQSPCESRKTCYICEGGI